MAVDVQGFTLAVFNRLKSDSQGTAVRAALGAGADSVCTVDDLRTFVLDATQAPRRPLVALRQGPVSGESYDMRPLLFTWWIYDNQGAGYAAINGLLTLIEKAYPRQSITFAYTAVTNIGQETTDSDLGWAVRTLQLSVTTRG